jgi:glycerol-3-phosphate dehydrogenase
MPDTVRDRRAGCFDVVIIGAGVVGCALARRFALGGADVIILEKASDILDGASKGNSAILHTGFDAPPGSLEQVCVAAGYSEYLEIHEALGLPLIRSGALVIAWTEQQAETLPSLMERARANGVADVEPFTRKQALALEPNLSPALHAAFRVPGEYLVDPWSAPYAYLLQAVENGAQLHRGCEVLSGRFDGECWRLVTTNGEVRGRWVVNAAGLYGDLVDERLTGRRKFQIRPRKGQFVVYDKRASALTSHILLPVPTPITKGVVICHTAFGNLLAGPTAEDQEARDEATLVPEALVGLRKRAEEILPALKHHDVTAVYAGLRPATEYKDYVVQADPETCFVTVGGIRSTGLSGALGIARHVVDLVADQGVRWTPLSRPPGLGRQISVSRASATTSSRAMAASFAIANSPLDGRCSQRWMGRLRHEAWGA